VWSGILFVAYLLKYTDQPPPCLYDFASFWYSIICLTLAPISFAVGTWYYLHRVEP
jgi:hypothetical protein